MPARVVNFMPEGVIAAVSRSTVMMPLQSGRMAAMHSKQPHEVIGLRMML